MSRLNRVWTIGVEPREATVEKPRMEAQDGPLVDLIKELEKN